MVPTRAFQIGASYRCGVGVRIDAEHLVMRQLARAAGEIRQLFAQVLGKIGPPAPGILQHASHGQSCPPPDCPAPSNIAQRGGPTKPLIRDFTLVNFRLVRWPPTGSARPRRSRSMPL